MLLTIASFIFFTALVGALTYFLTRGDDHGSSTGYFLAGRTLTGGYIAGSLMLTNLSTEQLVGLNGLAFSNGISVMAWEVLAGVSLVVMALFFLPRYLKSGISTIPEFLAERFDNHTRTITSIIFIIAYAGILLPIILYTGATGLIGILDLPTMTGLELETLLWIVVWLIGIIGSIYAIFGGLRTVAVSDTINGFGLLVGGAMIVLFGLYAVNSDGPIAAYNTLVESHPEKFNSLGRADSSVPWSTLFSGVLLINLFYWCTNQQIIQRTFGASSLKEGQRGVLMAGYLKVLAPLILVLPGIIAFHLFAREGIEADHAYGRLVQTVLPKWMAGFFAAAIFGAILSSYNSALNSTATLFSLGVYKEMLHRDASDRRVIWTGKIFAAILAFSSMTLAPLLIEQKSIFDYLQKMNALYFIPIFAVVLIGILSKRTPAMAANIALVLGVSVISFVYFAPIEAVQNLASDPEEIYGAFRNFHFIGVVFVALLALMYGIRLIKPRPEPYVQRESGAVDMTPWPWAWPLGLMLVVFVVGLYLFYADFSVVADSPRVE